MKSEIAQPLRTFARHVTARSEAQYEQQAEWLGKRHRFCSKPERALASRMMALRTPSSGCRGPSSANPRSGRERGVTRERGRRSGVPVQEPVHRLTDPAGLQLGA